MRSAVRLGLVLGALGLVTALGMPPAAAVGDGSIGVTSTIDGHSLRTAGSNSPIVLRPSDNTVLNVRVTNNGSAPVEIRSVRLDARVLGLAFFSYTTRVDLTLAPGATGDRTFALDLGDLDGQATGLLPAELALIAPNRSVLAAEHGTVDVKGKITSVYGVFGLAVAAITGLLLLGLMLRLVRRTLPENRWHRALRFAVPGVGLGLVATFTLGVVRVAEPSTGLSLGLLVGGLVVGFVLGYLTPSPADEADRDELDEADVVAAPQVVVVPPSRPTAPPVAYPPAAPPPPPPPPAPPVEEPTKEPVTEPVDEPTAAMPRPEPDAGDVRETRIIPQPPPAEPPSA